MATIEELARRQLAAYNASDLEAFVGCYHPDVLVLDGQAESLSGQVAFRERYRAMFEGWSFGAEVSERMVLDSQCFDFERWWRVDPETGNRLEGTVVVRYESHEGLIGTVQFFR